MLNEDLEMMGIEQTGATRRLLPAIVPTGDVSSRFIDQCPHGTGGSTKSKSKAAEASDACGRRRLRLSHRTITERHPLCRTNDIASRSVCLSVCLPQHSSCVCACAGGACLSMTIQLDESLLLPPTARANFLPPCLTASVARLLQYSTAAAACSWWVVYVSRRRDY